MGDVKISFGTEAQNRDVNALLERNRDVTAPLDAKVESSTAPGVDSVSGTATPDYMILRTEVAQEVGRLRSFIESTVRSLCSQFETESARVGSACRHIVWALRQGTDFGACLSAGRRHAFSRVGNNTTKPTGRAPASGRSSASGHGMLETSHGCSQPPK